MDFASFVVTNELFCVSLQEIVRIFMVQYDKDNGDLIGSSQRKTRYSAEDGVKSPERKEHDETDSISMDTLIESGSKKPLDVIHEIILQMIDAMEFDVWNIALER